MRATIYIHFPTRESLIEAVTERAISEATRVVEAAEPECGEPADALRRVVAAAWNALGRFHAVVAINTQLTQDELHRRHQPLLAPLEPLIQRGQRDGTFGTEVSPTWRLATILALVHAASGELRAGRLPADEAEAAVVATVLGALTARPIE